jgi:hypothetical protein
MAAYGPKNVVAEATRKARREEAVRRWRLRKELMSSPGRWVILPDGTVMKPPVALTLKQANHILAKTYGYGSTRKAAENFDRSLRRDLPRKKRPERSLLRPYMPPDLRWEWDFEWDMES